MFDIVQPNVIAKEVRPDCSAVFNGKSVVRPNSELIDRGHHGIDVQNDLWIESRVARINAKSFLRAVENAIHQQLPSEED